MVTEATTVLAVDLPDLRNTTDLLVARVRVAPGHIAFGRHTASGLIDVTTEQFFDECRALAGGLLAQGVGPGDRVLVMAPTRYEWAVADLAIWLAGGVVVPVYETSSARQVTEIIAETTPQLALVSDQTHAKLMAEAAPTLPTWTMDGADRDLIALAEFGKAVPDDEIERRRTLAGPDDIATIVYTSGTTARQKGVRITHGNLVGVVLNVAHDYRELIHDQAVTIVALPLAHVLARGLQLIALAAGMKVVHVSDRTKVIATFAEVRPTFMVVVPYLLSRIRQAARDRAGDAHLGPVFRLAESTAVAWSRFLEARQDDPALRPAPWLALRHALFDRLFYARLRQLLGGRLDWLLSGAASLDPGLSRFFWGIGVPVIEGYGLTETTAPATGLRPGDLRPGSVGTPIPGTTIRIAADGEVLVRGVGVFAGYQNPAEDTDTFADGFFRTGDLGSLDEGGHLTIHGRLKHLVVTALGKNVAPEPWEDSVSLSPLVAYAVLVGEGRSHLAGLLLLDVDATRRWATQNSHTDLLAQLDTEPTASGVLIDHPALHARLQRSVDRANSAVSRAEQVRQFSALLVDTTASSAVMTPTLKLRRDAFLTAAARHVDALFAQRPH